MFKGKHRSQPVAKRWRTKWFKMLSAISRVWNSMKTEVRIQTNLQFTVPSGPVYQQTWAKRRPITSNVLNFSVPNVSWMDVVDLFSVTSAVYRSKQTRVGIRSQIFTDFFIFITLIICVRKNGQIFIFLMSNSWKQPNFWAVILNITQ